jgi:hypothetical protein
MFEMIVGGPPDWHVGSRVNQSRTRRSPPAKQSTVRIEGVGDADDDDVGGGIEGVSGIGWKDQLSFVDSDKNSNRLLLWCPVVHFPAILF